MLSFLFFLFLPFSLALEKNKQSPCKDLVKHSTNIGNASEKSNYFKISEICRSISTNRFIAPLLFTHVEFSEKNKKW